MRSRALATAVVVTALVTGACSGGGGGSSSARKRVAPTTSTSVLVESQVIGGGTVASENETQTFPIDKTLTVVVPVGALTKGTEVEVREVTGANTDLGAVQVGGKVYSLGLKNGKIQPNKQVSLVYKLAEPLPAADPRPVGGWLDESDKVWRPVSVDRSAAGDEVTVFAPKVGKYTWLRWSWDKAVQAGADAVRQIVGPRSVGDGALACKSTDEVRARFDLQSNVGNALAWCAGRENGTDVIRVRNTGQAPLALRYKGFSTPSSTNTSKFFSKVADAARVVWVPTDNEGVTITEPGDELTFAITNAGEKGLLRAEVNGFSQHFDALAAAAAFITGYHAGNAAIASELLETNAPLRDLLVGQLAAKGCVNGLGDAVSQATYATDRLAAFTAQLTLKCIDGDVITMIRKEAGKTELGSLRSVFPSDDTATMRDRFGPALRSALGPVVEASGGPVAGEIIMTPKSGTTGDAPTLAPVGTAPAADPTVAPTQTTVGVVAGPATTLVIGTTTQATAPPVGTTTTAPAATTTTRAATTTTQAPATTTTTRATTTTTVAPTTTTAAPTGPMTFRVDSSPCGLTGGTLRSTSSGFRAGFKWTATIFSPSNRAFTSLGDVAANGSTGWTFNCGSATESGSYKVSISEVCPAGATGCTPRPEITTDFVVNVYDTAWVPQAERRELGICSGATVPGTPVGSFAQTFVAGGPTISEIGILNQEEIRGSIAVYRGGVELRRAPLTLRPGVAVATLALDGLVAGETLRFALVDVVATAPSPNHALNFWWTNSAVGAAGAVSSSNTCSWKDPSHLLDPPAGADVLAWIAP